MSSLSLAPPICWANLMPIDDSQQEVWLLAVRCKPATAFTAAFWHEAEWLVVPREALVDLAEQSADSGVEVHVSWVAWGKPDIEEQQPLGVHPPLLIDLDFKGEEQPDLEEAANDIQEWLEALKRRFPCQNVTVEFTGGKGIHLILNEWDASGFSHEENPRNVYARLRRDPAIAQKVFRPDAMHQMYRLPNSLYGYGDAEPWRTRVVAAGELDNPHAIHRHLLKAWSDSGYWNARKTEAEGTA